MKLIFYSHTRVENDLIKSKLFDTILSAILWHSANWHYSILKYVKLGIFYIFFSEIVELVCIYHVIKLQEIKYTFSIFLCKSNYAAK